jgi:anti-sigma B factor antagonist
MKIEREGECLSISEIDELTAANSSHFRDEISSAMNGATLVIEIDLSKTQFMDSSGLGALFALYRATAKRERMVLRLLNPVTEVEQLLELTQMQQLFEIVRR